MLLSSLDQAQPQDMKVRETRILTVLGEDAVRTGDRMAAVKWLQEAADVARRSGLHRIEARMHGSELASVLSDSGDYERAASYARLSVGAAGQAGDVYHLPQRLAALADIEASRGDLAAAETAYSKATGIVNSLFTDLPCRPRRGDRGHQSGTHLQVPEEAVAAGGPGDAVREAAAEYDRLVEQAEEMGRLRSELQHLRDRLAALEEEVDGCEQNALAANRANAKPQAVTVNRRSSCRRAGPRGSADDRAAPAWSCRRPSRAAPTSPPRPFSAHHVVVDALGQHLGGVGAEARGQDAVERRRNAAALQMAQHGDARLHAERGG